MDAIMTFFVILLVVVGIAAWAYDKALESFKSFDRKRATAAAEMAILKATGDPSVTQLMILLREDQTYGARSKQKLEAMCTRPELAEVAFLAALESRDPQMQTAGILGLVHLRSTASIVPLLELRRGRSDWREKIPFWEEVRSSNDLRAKTSEALIELANVAPISGPNGFLAIFGQFRTHITSSLKEEIGYLERLLEIAAARRAAFSDAEFEDLCRQAFSVSAGLISSGNTYSRHIGEDFMGNVSRLKAAQKHHSAGTSYKAQDRRSQYVGGDARSQQQWRRQGTEWPERTVYRPPDYYKILQVDPSAEPEVIAGAYRRLAAKYHPDKNNAPGANEKMQTINEAYEVLSNPIQRGRYDRARSAR